MGEVAEYQHKGLADGRWAKMSLPFQMANIGSEVSRALRWKREAREDRMLKAVYRGLELIDLSIDAAKTPGALKELCRALMSYYEQFESIAR